jgi:hypothetical protein
VNDCSAYELNERGPKVHPVHGVVEEQEWCALDRSEFDLNSVTALTFDFNRLVVCSLGTSLYIL